MLSLAKLTPKSGNALVDSFSDTGAQPLISQDGKIALAVNGEIYNHKILRKQLKHQYNFKTHSDCEIIIPLVCISFCFQEELSDMRLVRRIWQ